MVAEVVAGCGCGHSFMVVWLLLFVAVVVVGCEVT